MPVLMLIAIAVVLAGIFFAATGRGGELAYEQADHAPLDLGPVSAADIALLRPPSAMWGYNMQVTDAALDQIARAMRERDVTIAYLQDQLASAQRNGSYAQPRGAHARPFSVTSPGLAALEPAEDGGPLARSEGQAALAPFEAREPAGAGAPEELADPEPLEPLEAASSRTAEPAGTDTDTDAPSGYDAPGDYDTPDYDTPDYDTPDDHGAPGDYDTADDYEAPQAPEPPVAESRPAEVQPAESRPAEARPAPDVPTFTPTATYRQTPLVLKASGPKPPPAPGRHETTQPSAISEAAEERESRDPTEPNATLSHTHDWWAEQTEAAQQERARRQAAGETVDAEEEETARSGDDPLAAEEQGW